MILCFYTWFGLTILEIILTSFALKQDTVFNISVSLQQENEVPNQGRHYNG